VCVCVCVLYGNFVDNLRLYVKGGSGGMGLPRLGGQGGKGGDVWVVTKEAVTLKKVKDKHPQKRILAGAGVNSSVRALKGDKGEDQLIFAPPGIVVTSDDQKVLGELNGVGEKVLVARGGHGGTFHTGYLPSRGQARHIRLDLKLIADVGLVGFPNAGKSSLLTKLSHAKPHIASYPFTTLRPELGKIVYPDYRQISMADLPGLIEGAHVNKGMGHKFLKHVERTRQLVFVVDVCGFQLSPKTPFRSAFETVQLLIKELELYNEELLSKPALLVVNKMDLTDTELKLKELLGQLQDPEGFYHTLPKDMVPRHSVTFKDVLPVSAATGLGVEELKTCIRHTLEQEAAMESKELCRERLQALRVAAQPPKLRDPPVCADTLGLTRNSTS
uniref:GTP-binding protein 10 n=1 Tax=Scleropages formosus TaxID=113540 RepID=A0A8C9REN0_SCLFO